MKRRAFLASLATTSLAGCSGEKATPTPGVRTKVVTRTVGVERSANATQPDTGQSTEWSADSQKHDKLIGAYYYPWYEEHENWTRSTPGQPVLGNYRSDNPDVINQHIKWAVEHGINWFPASWSSRNNFRDKTLRNHFLQVELIDKIKFSINIPSHGVFLPPSSDSIYRSDFDNEINHRILKENLSYLEETYFHHPSYLEIDGRPVLWFFLAKNFVGDVRTAFQEAKAEVETDPYIIGDLFGDLRRNPGQKAIFNDWVDEFDAATIYNIKGRGYGIYTEEEVPGYDEFVDVAVDELLNLYLQADNEGLDFIPNITPGFDHSEWRNRGNKRILERKAEGFRELCERVLGRMDPDLDAILITSFNEWPEYTAIEPAEEYGTTYLDIISEELPRGEPEYIDITTFCELKLDFNKTFDPGKLYGDEPSGRDLAINLVRLYLLDKEGSKVADYNIGYPLEEPHFADGAYLPRKEDTEGIGWVRDLGGPRGQTVIYLGPNLDPVSTANILALPIVSNQIEADVYFEGDKTDQITFEDRKEGWVEYEVQLNQQYLD